MSLEPPRPQPNAPAPAPATPGARGGGLRAWLALPVGAAVLAALVAYAGPGALASAFRGAAWPFLALAVLAYGWFFLLRGWRWAYLLRSAGVPGGFLLPATLGPVAWMVSTFLPFKAGDAVRAVVLARRRQAPLAAVAGTVAMERALDLAGLAAAASLGLGVLAARHTALPDPLGTLLVVAWLVPLAGLAACVALAVLLRSRPRASVPLRLLGQLLDGVLAIARHPRLVAPALAWTLAVKAAQVSVYVLLVQAFLPGTPVLAVALLVPLFLLSFMVALTPGHVGTYEAAFVLVFSLAGLAPARLAAAAVAIHLSAIAIVCALGCLSLAALGAARPRLPALAAAAAAPRARTEDTPPAAPAEGSP